jgi:hypothetical protein
MKPVPFGKKETFAESSKGWTIGNVHLCANFKSGLGTTSSVWRK